MPISFLIIAEKLERTDILQMSATNICAVFFASIASQSCPPPGILWQSAGCHLHGRASSAVSSLL